MKLRYILLLNIIIVLAACTTPAQVQQDWSDPEQKKDSTKVFQKILFVALLKNDAARRLAENKLVDQVKGRGVASYTYLTGSAMNNDERMLSDKLKQDGFDGVVVMRLATIDNNATYVPGMYPTYYSTWYGYYSSSYPRFNDPGNPSANTYNIETNVYSLTSGKLVWTGITTAVNISDTEKMVDKVIAMVKQKMKSQGLIK